jgi:MFS family permease
VLNHVETGQDAGVPRSVRRRVLAVLGLTQTVSWGVLYYAFPVLAPSISRDTSWSTPNITAAFSLALVTSAGVGLLVGRRLDRGGPRTVMTAGSLLGVAAVVGIALAPTYPLFLVTWLFGGAAMAATLYPPAFAALTRWWHPHHVQALTALTLVAGFASTVFAPITAMLDAAHGWRPTYLILAAVLAVVTVPTHALGLRGPWPPDPRTRSHHVAPQLKVDQTRIVARGRRFSLLAVALTLGAFASTAALINLVPLLLERGISATTAAAVLGIGGAGQVAGRLLYPRLSATTTPAVRTALVLAAIGATIGGFAVVPTTSVPVLVAVAVLAGAARGLNTLIQATAITDRWGSSHYGRLSSRLSGSALLATASAPWAGSALAAAAGDYGMVFLLLAALAAIAAVIALRS